MRPFNRRTFDERGARCDIGRALHSAPFSARQLGPTKNEPLSGPLTRQTNVSRTLNCTQLPTVIVCVCAIPPTEHHRPYRVVASDSSRTQMQINFALFSFVLFALYAERSRALQEIVKTCAYIVCTTFSWPTTHTRQKCITNYFCSPDVEERNRNARRNNAIITINKNTPVQKCYTPNNLSTYRFGKSGKLTRHQADTREKALRAHCAHCSQLCTYSTHTHTYPNSFTRSGSSFSDLLSCRFQWRPCVCVWVCICSEKFHCSFVANRAHPTILSTFWFGFCLRSFHRP